MCKNNPPIASKTETVELIDCKPISFGDMNHVWLLELQQPCKPTIISHHNFIKTTKPMEICMNWEDTNEKSDKGKGILTEHWRDLHLLRGLSENPYKKTSIADNT